MRPDVNVTTRNSIYDHQRNQRLSQKHLKVTYDSVSIVINNVSISRIISNQKRCQSRGSDHLELTNQEAKSCARVFIIRGGGASALYMLLLFSSS